MSDACGLVRLLRPAPQTDHSSLPPELWIDIFRYATYVPRIRGLSPGDPFEPQRPSNYAWGVNTPVSSLATKRNVVLVCRAWYCLATELLYEHVVISSRRRAFLLLRTLHHSDRMVRRMQARGEITEGLARWVRHVEIHDCARTSKSLHFWSAVAAILSLLPNLHVLSGIWERPLAKNLLEVFSRYLTSSIQGLYWDEGLIPEGEPSLLSSAFLPKYQSLRVLDIRKLRLEDPDTFPADTASSISLPSVVDLLLPTCPAVLGFARKLELPRLRRLVLDAANLRRNSSSYVSSSLNKLLAAHGPKITTLELLPMTSLSYQASPISITTFLQPDVCPMLETFVFDCREKLLNARSPPPSSPELHTPNRTLRRIGIRGMGISRLYPNRPSHAQEHLHSLLRHRALFPVLETVRTVGFLVDACTDQFARDIFIWWTEKFEEQGLDMQDGEGVVWLYTDPADGKQEIVAQDEIVAEDHASLVHKSDAEEVKSAKA
ncbi:uncharacterized protein C8Q71DRAFT_703613 [Rhodofomes roseus]|uniref:F-box domain-containing protein n=1 Tax=Rhodofomes roseus TaxID=34475 RepID=A0ABQ8KM28_9APHY|nr:uncharacterized protein C8Q71DRAFT_703613 [Rhodofomes roseus]KAH9839125.1 hypothetical protein C8Q71DRAFT_703613 [Rhodofomes roseus]